MINYNFEASYWIRGLVLSGKNFGKTWRLSFTIRLSMVYTLLEIDAEIPRIKKQNTQNIHVLLGREELIHCVCDKKN